MPQINPAALEWLVIRTSGDNIPEAGFAQDGDRRTLADATARQVELGIPWSVSHYFTMVPPADHQRWLNGAGAKWAP